LSIATAACAASEPSSVTSSRENGRAVRFAANRTPRMRLPSRTGTPAIATMPSSATAASISVRCRNRADTEPSVTRM
jgi:hypothetical protein